MSVPSPPCQWPESLEERGSSEDPSILLTGEARIGEAAIQIVAIRVDPAAGWAPDYKPGVAASSYQAEGLDVLLETTLEELDCAAEQLSDFRHSDRQNIVTLAGRPYRIWLLSAPARS